MDSKSIYKMVTTAILIALTVVFQLMRPLFGGSNPVSTYIVGSLVNLTLIVASCVVGLYGGAAVGIVAPLIAFWQGHAVFPMVWCIMGGNVVLAVVYALLARGALGNAKADWVRFCAVGVVAAVVKYAVILLGQAVTLTTVKGQAFGAALGAAAVAQIQQVVTAVVGMIVARLLIIALPRQALRG